MSTYSGHRRIAIALRKKRVRYAVIGLGYFAQAAVLPAFSHAKNSELAALVSSDPEKLNEIGDKYGIELRCSYDDLDYMLSAGHVDAAYIALPNNMHCKYTIRTANEHVHVLCEKPMAVTEEECREMIRACEENQVKLVRALYRSADTGEPVKLEPYYHPRRPGPEQQIGRPASWFQPELVNAESPSGQT